MPSRTLRTLRVAAATAAGAMVLSACTTIHPGQAVVVGDDSLSRASLDDLSVSYCALNAVISEQQAAQSGVEAVTTATAGADARRQAAQAFITGTVAERTATDVGVSVRESEYVLTEEQLGQIDDAFDDADTEGVRDLLEDDRRTQLLITAIGAEELDVELSAETTEDAQATGQKAVQEAIKAEDLSIDPRLGLSESDASQVGTSGSLSVAQSTLSQAAAVDLPSLQQCL